MVKEKHLIQIGSLISKNEINN